MISIRSGGMFFYKNNGAPSTVVSVTMKEEVQEQELSNALCCAIVRYPYLRKKIVKKAETLYLDDNDLPFIIRNSGENISLGCVENNYHIIDVHYF